MATSNSVNYSTTRDGLIAFALKKAGVVAKGAIPSAAQISDAAVELNLMVKAWQADGLQLWAKKLGYLFLQKDVTKYTLGPGGSHTANSYVRTAVSAAASVGSVNISVDSIEGISDTNFVGIKLDDGSLFWSTINGVPASGIITLAASVTANVSEGAVVFVYSTKINRPLRILSADVLDVFDTSIDITVQSLDEFWGLPTKTEEGKVTQVAFIPTLTTSELYVWPQTQDVSDVIEFWYHRPFEDFDASSDEPDFPQEWYFALGYNLALHLGVSYGTPAEMLKNIAAIAVVEKDNAMTFDAEQSSVFFSPESQG